MTSISFRVSSDETELLRAFSLLDTQTAKNFNNRFKSLIAELLEDWKQVEVLEKSLPDKFHFELFFNDPQMHSGFREEENQNKSNLEKQKELFKSLTRKEISVLVFIYKGYRQKEVSYILQMAINTFRHHRKSLYRKMGFRNKIEMAIWCDKNLSRFFGSVHKM